MDNLKKRLFAFFLAVAMVVGCLPAMALAEEKEGWSSDYSKYFYYKDGELVASDVEVDEVKEPTCTKGTITVYRAKDVGETTEVESGDKLGHSYSKGLVTETTATCEKEGYHYNKCDRCGEPDEEHKIKDAALGHKAGNPVRENETPATCTTAGYYEEVTYCENCRVELKREKKTTDPATGKHTWGEEEVLEEKKPSCTKAGYAVVKKTCTVCGATETERIELDAPGHEWKLTKETKKPTCGKEGEGLWTCSVCKATETRPIEATGKHDYKEEQIYDDDRFMAPTCDQDGVAVYANICQNCKHEEEGSRDTKSVARYNHIYPDNYKDESLRGKSAYHITSTEATCTLPGATVWTCELCGHTKEGVKRALGHEFEKDSEGNDIIVSETVTKPETCEEDGLKDVVKHCTRCGEDIEEKDVVIDEYDGHDPLVRKENIKKRTTCLKAGRCDYVTYCKRCKKELNREKNQEDKDNPALDDHAFDEDNPVEWTCKGKLVKCQVCGELNLQITKEDEEKHVWTLEKTLQAPTCTAKGTDRYKCDFCNKTEEREVDELGHLWSIVVTKPTCEKDGVSAGTCSRCKKVSGGEKVDRLGHTYDEKNTTAKAYWNADTKDAKGTGYIVYTTPCSNGCGKSKTQVVNFEADEKGKKQTVELNLQKKGKDTIYKVYFTAKITSEETKAATCVAPSETTFTATFDQTLPSGKKVVLADQKITEKNDDIIPHTPGEAEKVNVVEADCVTKKDGSYDLVVKCTACGNRIAEYPTRKVTVKWEDSHDIEDRIENEKHKDDSDTLPYEYYLVKRCKKCNAVVDKKHYSVPKNGHVPAPAVDENYVEPDCRNHRDGYVEHVVYCKDCDPKVEILRDPEVLYWRDSHDYVWEQVYEKEPTCTEYGRSYEVKKCTKCGKEERRTPAQRVKPLGHSSLYTKNVLTKAPTCTEPGKSYEATFCGLCNEEINKGEEVDVPALGHEWDEGTVTKQPTAEEKGVKTFTCVRPDCGETKTEEIDNSKEIAAANERKAAIAAAEAASSEADKLDASIYKVDSLRAIAEAYVALDAILRIDDAETETIKAATGILRDALAKAEKKGSSSVILNNKNGVFSGHVIRLHASDAKITGSTGKLSIKYYSNIDCTNRISVRNLVNAGTYYAKAFVEADDNFFAAESSVASITIAKRPQVFSAAGRTLTVSATTLKKIDKHFWASQAISITGARGKVSIEKISGNGKITIDSKGKFTISKGLKAGTYKVKVRVSASGSSNYMPLVKTAVVTVKVN